MIKLYYEKNKQLEKKDIDVTENQVIAEGTWIDLIQPTKEEVEWVKTQLNVPVEFIMAALDEEETAHVDTEDDAKLIILDVPILVNAEKKIYSTTPFAIISTAKHFITVSVHPTDIVQELLLRTKKLEPHKKVRLTLLFLYRLASMYISYLKKIDAYTKVIEKQLHQSMRNKELFELMELNKSLVYFSTSLNANRIVIHKLTRSAEFKKYEDDFDLLEDSEIEMNQAIEMCSVYRGIMDGMIDAFASIISNNLNIVMKALTVVTIALSIPTLVASFYGMNLINIPLAEGRASFYFIVIGSFLLSGIGAYILYRYTNRIKG